MMLDFPRISWIGTGISKILEIPLVVDTTFCSSTLTLPVTLTFVNVTLPAEPSTPLRMISPFTSRFLSSMNVPLGTVTTISFSIV